MGKYGIFLLGLVLTSLSLHGQSDWRDLLSPRGRVVDLSGRGMFEVPMHALMPDVEVLVLDDNDLTFLPQDLAARCPNLRALSVRNNQLTDVGMEISGLLRLEELYLDGNDIGRLEARGIQHLRSLRVLSVQNNGMVAFNLDLRAFDFLQVLWLDDNRLIKLPELGSCRNLLNLSAQNNQIDYLHADINRCEFLESLDLSGNRRLMGLPEELRFCDRLRLIDVSETAITEVPEWVADMPELEYFVLEEER